MKKAVSVMVILAILVSVWAFAGQKEKFAVVAEGKTLEAMKEKGMKAVAFNGSAKEAVKKVLHSKNMKIDFGGG